MLAKEISSFHKYACADFNIKSTSELSVKIISAGTGPKPTEINKNSSFQCNRLWIRPFLCNKGFFHHTAAMSPPSDPLRVRFNFCLEADRKTNNPNEPTWKCPFRWEKICEITSALPNVKMLCNFQSDALYCM